MQKNMKQTIENESEALLGSICQQVTE
jgi:hypothetical protein